MGSTLHWMKRVRPNTHVLKDFYRISDGEKSVILKQAGLSTRLSSERSISRKRNRREAAALEAENEILPGCAPKVYLYDETMDCMFMEDLKDYTVLRKALIEEDRIFPDFAEQISSLGHRMSVRIIFKKSIRLRDLPIRNCVR